MDYLRKWSRTTKNETADETILNNLVATDSADPANEQLSESMQRALAALPEKQKSIVVMLKVDGLSVKEVAAKTGASESAVKVTAHRAYKALRKRLEAIGMEDL